MSGMMQAEAIYQLNPPNETITQTGSSGMIDTTVWENFLVMASVGTPAGSTPQLAIHLDGFDPWGNVYQDLCSPQPILLFAGGAAQALVATVGIDAPFVAASSPGIPGNFNQLFVAPQKVALRWVISGAGASFPNFYLSMYGRG